MGRVLREHRSARRGAEGRRLHPGALHGARQDAPSVSSLAHRADPPARRNVESAGVLPAVHCAQLG